MNPAQLLGLTLVAVGAFIFGTGLAQKEKPSHTPSVPSNPDPVVPAEPTNPQE